MRRLALSLALALLISPDAMAQFATPPSISAGTVGGGCTSSSVNFAWPDASGHVLQCVSNVWQAVTQSGTPGSPTGSVQFNNSGSLGGSANLFWDSTNNRLGIGTNVPVNSLDVNGAVAIGSYAGLNTAPSNGLIVSGNVGIGSSSPITSLDVGGSLNVASGVGTSLTATSTSTSIGTTTILVNSTTGYPSSGTLMLSGSGEVMSYTGKTSNAFTGVTRGAYGTTATTHGSNSTANVAMLQVGASNNGGNYTSALTVLNGQSLIVGTPSNFPIEYSIAVGVNVYALYQSIAVGYNATASGNTAVAIGTNVTASAGPSQAFGSNTTAAATDEMVIGQYNRATGSEGGFTTGSSTNPLFVIGNGTSGQSANALMVFDSGQMLVGGGTTVAIPAGVASLTAMGTTTDNTAAALNATDSSGSSKLYVRNDGNVGIGNTSPAYLLHVGSASASGIVAEFQNSSGACTIQPGTSSITTSCSSDIRLKSNITDAGDALAWLDDMRVRDFTVRSTGERRTGVIAQEMLLTHPEMVRVNSDGFFAVDEPNPWKLVKALQQLKSDDDDLKLATHEKMIQIKTLRARLDALEAGQ